MAKKVAKQDEDDGNEKNEAVLMKDQMQNKRVAFEKRSGEN